jgi:hypothetical protein
MDAVRQAAQWTPVGRGERALQLLDAEPPTPEAAEQRILALTQLDRLEEAAEALAAADRDHPEHPRIAAARAKHNRLRVKPQADRARLKAALDAISVLPGEAHPNVFRWREGYLSCPRPGAKTVVCSFGIWLPLAAEDLLLGAMGYSAVHAPGLQMKFRRDPLWVIENRDQINGDLFELCRETDASWMLSLGASGQGMAALSFGARQKADGILAFSPISSLDPNVLAALRDMRSEGSILSPVLSSTERIKEVDVLVDMQAHPVETTVVYDPAHPFDSLHAERLSRAPHVRLEVLPGEGHHAAQVAVADGEFQPMLKDVLKRAQARGGAGRHLLHRDARRAKAERNAGDSGA